VLHAEESEFPPFEPSDFEVPEAEVDGHQLFSKPNKNAGENKSYATFSCIKTDSEEPEIDPVEAAEREAIQAEGCGLLSAEPSPVSVSNLRYDHGAQALHLASLGFHVFPLHTPEVIGGCSCGKSDCSNMGKHPRTMRGLKDATADPEQIKAWWRRWPHANIGIATGEVSNLLVIDVDPRHGGWESLEALMHRIGEVFPSTVEAITGGDGRHFLFQMPDADIRNSAGKLGAGLDVRANGGYIVAAPSLHASGQRYRWASDESPLAHLPYNLLRELITPPRLIEFKQRRGNVTVQTWTGGTVAEGARNETLFRQAAAMRGQGAHESEIFDALCALNRSCSPPLPERELSKVAASVMRYEPNGRSIFV
jgi:putative DNA primase/helicase